MKIIRLFVALCAILLCLGVNVAFAQEAPATVAVPTRGGADLLLEAGQLVDFSAFKSNLSLAQNDEAEQLKFAHLLLAKNAKALDKLRAAIEAGVAMPANYDAKLSDALGVLSPLLAHEAAVRAADGDVMGAAQSSLDVFRLATQVGSGNNGLFNANFAQSLATNARLMLEQVAPQFDAAQLREVAAKWESLDAQMPIYAEQLPAEGKNVLREMALADMKWLRDPKARAKLLASLDDPKLSPDSVASFRGFLAIPFDEIEPEIHRLFAAAAIQNATSSYQQAVQVPLRKGVNAYIARHAGDALGSYARFSFERSTANNRLFIAALRLRAVKLETGAYPATFDAGADPFSLTLVPLVYQREGDFYLLYSVGPDGKDEGGAEMQTLSTNPETGLKSVNGNVLPESTGDVVAPVL